MSKSKGLGERKRKKRGILKNVCVCKHMPEHMLAYVQKGKVRNNSSVKRIYIERR